jgi:hypothetical protein
MIRRLSALIAIVVGSIGPAVALIIAPPASAAPAAASAVAPITSAVVEGGDTWLVVPMGHLDNSLNTFWQIFVRTPTATGWRTVTPPGVADNGGLVIGPSPAGGLLAGFLVSQFLTFSPLSSTGDSGRTWNGIYFPEALIGVPDALGGTATGPTLGLGGTGGGTLLEAGPGLSSWKPAITARTLAQTTAGARCGVERLTAAAVAPDGDPLVGTECRRRGTVGLFDVAGPGAQAVTFPASPVLRGAAVSVLRLVPTAGGLAVLLRAEAGDGRTTIVAGWLADGAPAVGLSSPLAVPAAGRLGASGTTPGGGLFVLLQPGGGGAPELATVSSAAPAGAAWNVLPHPPRGTLAAAFSPGRIDAVTVHDSTLIDYSLDEASATWVRSQVVHVDIQYGSSD